MSKRILLFLIIALAINQKSIAQLSVGDTAPDWTFTDLDGNSHHLYDILDQGKDVIIDFSATWCGPCWNYHNSGTLDQLYANYGPDGTDELMVFFIEGDIQTTLADLNGTGTNTRGDWVSNTHYPIINISSQQVLSDYKIPHWPSVYSICSDRTIKSFGAYNVSYFESALNSCPVAVPPIEIVNTQVNDASCTSSTDGSITLTLTGPNAPFTVYWSNGSINTGTLTNVQPGTYNASIIDSNGNFVEAGPFQVGYESEGIVAEVASITAANCTSGLGGVDIAILSGTPTSYEWSDGSNTQNASNLSPGEYSVIISDAGGCEQTIEGITVTGANVPDAVLEQSINLNCNSTTLEIDGTQSTTFNGDQIMWSTNGNILAGATTLTPTINQPGTYTLTISNDDGCTSETSIVVEEPELPTIIIDHPGVIDCTVDCLTLLATTNNAQLTTSWTTLDGLISAGANTIQPMVCNSGTYTVMVTDPETGCSNTQSISIEEDREIPNINIAGESELTCIQNAVQLSVEENIDYAYSWTNGNNMNVSTSPTIEVSSSNTYTVEVLNTLNGCVSSETIAVIQNTTTPQIEISTSNELTCAENSATLDAAIQGGMNPTYIWTYPSGESVENQTSSLEVSSAGTYYLSVLNENGCESSSEITVIGSADTPEAFATSGQISCQNPTTTITGNSNMDGVDYNWSGPNEFTSNEQNPTVTTAGEYLLTVTSENGCSSSTTTNVEGDSEIPQILSISGYADCSESGLNIEVSGEDNQYQWSGPNGFTSNEQNPNLTNASEGTYLCVVTNTSGCITESSTLLEDNSDFPTVNSISGELNCTNASLAVAVMNDNNYSYSWAGPNGFTSNEQNPTIESAGTYQCEITSSTGCTTVAETEVEANTDLQEIEVTAGVLDCTNPTTTIITETNTNNLLYTWSGPNGFTSDISNPEIQTSGLYTLTTMNADNGCESSTSITIMEDTKVVEITFEDEFINCDESEIQIQSTEDITWTDDQGNVVTAISSAGNYEGTFVGDNGCEGQTSLKVNEDFELPDFTLQADEITCKVSTASLSLNTNSEIRSITWSGPGITQANMNQTNPTVSVAGLYNADVIGMNGCMDSKEKEVTETPMLEMEIASIVDISCYGASDGKIEFDIISGTLPLTFNYDFSNNLVRGTYFAKIKDANGCEEEISFEIKEPNAIDVAFKNIENATSTTNGAATAAPLGGTPPFTYLWNDGTTTAHHADLTVGDHTVMTTDDNDCTEEGTVTIEQATNLQSITSLNTFEVYPNPTNGLINLNLEFDAEKDFEIEVINLLGIKVYSKKVTNTNALRESINLTELSSGSYLLKIVTAKGQAVKKIALMK